VAQGLSLSRLRNIVQNQQVGTPAGCYGIGASSVVAEFNERSLVVKLLDDRTDLPAGKPVCWKVRQQRHCGQKGRFLVLCIFRRIHHSTQQVTNVSAISPDC
jgi:hypothetical protein